MQKKTSRKYLASSPISVFTWTTSLELIQGRLVTYYRKSATRPDPNLTYKFKVWPPDPIKPTLEWFFHTYVVLQIRKTEIPLLRKKTRYFFFFKKGVSVTPYFKPHLQLLGIKFLPSKWAQHKFGLSIAPPFTPYQDFVRGSKTEKKMELWHPSGPDPRCYFPPLDPKSTKTGLL